MTINERIKQVRKTLKMSQVEFARAIFISNGYIAEIESEHCAPNDRIIRLISFTFGVNEAWLRTGESEMFYKSPNEKIERILSLFNELPPKFQDYVVLQIEQLFNLSKDDSR
jgi:transcriptional regulator with XRE-family HTH domain